MREHCAKARRVPLWVQPQRLMYLLAVALFSLAGVGIAACFPPHCAEGLDPDCCNSAAYSLSVSPRGGGLYLADLIEDDLISDSPPSMSVTIYRIEDATLVADKIVEFYGSSSSGYTFNETMIDRTDSTRGGFCHFHSRLYFEMNIPADWQIDSTEQFPPVELDVNTGQFESENDYIEYQIWDRLTVGMYWNWWIS